MFVLTLVCAFAVSTYSFIPNLCIKDNKDIFVCGFILANHPQISVRLDNNDNEMKH